MRVQPISFLELLLHGKKRQGLLGTAVVPDGNQGKHAYEIFRQVFLQMTEKWFTGGFYPEYVGIAVVSGGVQMLRLHASPTGQVLPQVPQCCAL
jgi:hypothetical protein